MVRLLSYKRVNRRRREYSLRLVKSWFFGLIKREKWIVVRVKNAEAEKRMRKHWADLVKTGKRIDIKKAAAS